MTQKLQQCERAFRFETATLKADLLTAIIKAQLGNIEAISGTGFNFLFTFFAFFKLNFASFYQCRIAKYSVLGMYMLVKIKFILIDQHLLASSNLPK
jgi:hypothetical protein